MSYTIKKYNKESEIDLSSFLYDAIFVRKGETPPPYSIVEKEELKVYTENFGKEKDDHLLYAEEDGKIVGCVWVRVMDDYGHIDDETPSLAISVKKEYRNRGIGRRLMEEMLYLLSSLGYRRTSLSVQKENYALRLYQSLGYRIHSDKGEEYIMVKDLC